MPPYNASDPTARFLSSSCLDFLLIELVPLAYRVTNEVEAAAAAAAAGNGVEAGQAGLDGTAAGGSSPANEAGTGTVNGGQVGGIAGSGSGSGVAGLGIVADGKGAGTGTGIDEEEEREAVFWRLEGIGYRVGQGLVERYVLTRLGFHVASTSRFGAGRGNLALPWEMRGQGAWACTVALTHGRFSRDRPRFNDTLDVIKFLCKDLWTLVFRKQVDNLKTNHRVCLPLPSLSLAISKLTTRKGSLRPNRQLLPPLRPHERRNRQPGSPSRTAGNSPNTLPFHW
jgi:hypothetical protein